MTLRLLEHYTSIQGECDRTGVPTQFIRFAGCNLKCPGWPCDTPFAIDPKLYRTEQVQISPGKLRDDVILLANTTGAVNTCFTGGEPMLQPTQDILALAGHISDVMQYDLEMFSNGTIEYPYELLRNCAIRMDWKLPGSGEGGVHEIVRGRNYHAMGEFSHHTIKFTIKHQADFDAALAVYQKYGMFYWPGSIYAGPVWNQEYTAQDVANNILANQLPWKLNVQTHNYVFGAHTRRT